MVAVDRNQKPTARSRRARPGEDDKPSRPAGQGFHLGPWRAARELQLKHHVPDQQRRGKRGQNWPHHSPPVRQSLDSRPLGTPGSALRDFRSDRRPGFGWRRHLIEPERQRADNVPVFFQ